MVSPTHPVIVGAHELAVRTADAEPVAMMTAAAEAALSDTGGVLREQVESIRVVRGIWPYVDPGRLVAQQLGLDDVTTAITQIGGNATYDLVNTTAVDIAAGRVRVAIVCGAESMRTRRKDKSEGRRSSYLPEDTDASADLVVGEDVELVDGADIAADVFQPVNFYAMAESAIRHERSETPSEHLDRISELWSRCSDVATTNPHAWITETHTPSDIATPSPTNRMVAAPYTKLLTSNINVDQGAAVVMCSYEAARAAGIDDTRMVYLLSGSGAYDHLSIRQRDHLHRSPAFGLSARRALGLAGLGLEEADLLDLYSCFPASVQLAQNDLGVDDNRSFTITGGLTFAGGPYNGYCTQALAHTAEMLRGSTDTALLYGNGGYFSKHSVLVASGAPPATDYRYERLQAEVDELPRRAIAETVSGEGTIEAYTVVYNRDGEAQRAILSVLDANGSRHWAQCEVADDIASLLEADAVGMTVRLTLRPDFQVNGHPAVASATLA